MGRVVRKDLSEFRQWRKRREKRRADQCGKNRWNSDEEWDKFWGRKFVL
jgi:hypothetical protein